MGGVREVTKQLGGIEDLTLGNDTETQTRNGTEYVITKVSGASLPNDAASGDSIKTVTAVAQAAAEAAQATADASAPAAAASAAAALISETNAATSETAAGLSETAAGLSETAAGLSETAAGLSETNAAASETAAGLSETAAGLSETAAGLSETAAGLSETAAGTSASAAIASASAAAASETAAGLSETAAGLSETAAGLSETAAGLSETAAGLSETNASASETAAGLSETAAGLSETAAGLSETAAAVSAAAAVVSETNAAASETAAGISETNAAASAAAASAVVLSNEPVRPSIRPSLLLDFANSRVLDPRIDFTRASTATYFDDKGVMQTAAVDKARFDHDSATGENLGMLIEESRTNLVLQSEDLSTTWANVGSSEVVNVIASPDGAVTADKFIISNGGVGYIKQDVTVGAAGDYVFSVFAKAAGFDWLIIQDGGLSDESGGTFADSEFFDLVNGAVGAGGTHTKWIEDIGEGWYKCSVLYTAVTDLSGQWRMKHTTADEVIANGDGTNGVYLWGAQLEAGSFPTSYIPTTTAQVTRAADAAVMTGTNFSDWYNQSEGSVYYEAAPIKYDDNYNIGFVISNGASDHDSFMSWPYSAQHLRVRVGNVVQADIDVGSAESGVFAKYAVSVKANDFAVSKDGGTIGADTSGLMPTVDSLYIGVYPTGTLHLNGHLKKLAYYPKALPDAEIIGVTQ